jgi:hypothetical protein
VEDLETLFRSNDLTARIFRNHAQIGKTVDALTRDRLYSMYGQEVEREMLARNREQFGFRGIDTPRVRDQKSRPSRAKSAMVAMLLTVPFMCGFYLLRGFKPRGSG